MKEKKLKTYSSKKQKKKTTDYSAIAAYRKQRISEGNNQLPENDPEKRAAEKEKINELKGEIKRLKELNPLGLEDQITNLKKQIEGIKKYGLGEISNGIDTRYNIKGYDNFSKEITSQMTGQKVILQSHHGGGTSSAVIKNEVCHI
ncbi:hypothetical protein, partial [Flammeovirga sp. SJP92]|uniref:hypothetical protein n=1 Tax=Flammeovirga sp. SJP92 TaxID=1775430 RepID=UPI0012F9E12C